MENSLVLEDYLFISGAIPSFFGPFVWPPGAYARAPRHGWRLALRMVCGRLASKGASRATFYMVRRSRYGGFVGVVFDGHAGAVFWALSLTGAVWAFFGRALWAFFRRALGYGEIKAANVHFGLYPMILTMMGLGWGAGGPAEH